MCTCAHYNIDKRQAQHTTEAMTMTVNQLIEIVSRYGEPKVIKYGSITWHGGKWEIVDGLVKYYNQENHSLVDVTEEEVVDAMEMAAKDRGHFNGTPAYSVYHNGAFVAVGWCHT